MDDQKPEPLDPSATRIQSGSKGRSSSRGKARESLPEQEQTQLSARSDQQVTRRLSQRPVVPEDQPTQTIPATPGTSRPRSSAPRRQSTPARPPANPVIPQPIRFPEVDVDVEVMMGVELTQPARRQRLHRTRRWLRSRPGRVVIPLVALVLGLLVAFSSLLWYGLSLRQTDGGTSSSVKGNLIIEVQKDFLTELVRQNINSSAGSLPGHLENVQVALKSGDQMTITADDVYSVVGVQLSRPLTIDLQPYVQNCLTQTRITHVDLGGLSVTEFAQSFTASINQQFAVKPTGLPEGFTYCTVNVHTEPTALFITYQATPTNP